MKCDYGCEQEAKYFFKRVKKWCCSSNMIKCPAIKEKHKKSMKGNIPWNKGKKNIYSEETIEKMRKAKDGLYNGSNNPMYGKEGVWKGKKRPDHSKVMKGKKGYWKGKKGVDAPNYGNTLTIEYINEKYPLFSKVEEMRYDPYNLGENIIQVHCKNHNCPNSKEQGGWFTPKKDLLKGRIYWIENEGKDNLYFYCSEKCKQECPLYRSQGIIPKENKYLNYTESEHQTFRKFVLERDNYICQFCGEKAVHVHHERPQKLEPFFTLDPDYAWSCCEKCHYEKGHKNECSSINIANKICKE